MTFRLTQEEFDALVKRRAPRLEFNKIKKPGQAATYAQKPDYARELAIQIRDAVCPPARAGAATPTRLLCRRTPPHRPDGGERA